MCLLVEVFVCIFCLFRFWFLVGVVSELLLICFGDILVVLYFLNFKIVVLFVSILIFEIVGFNFLCFVVEFKMCLVGLFVFFKMLVLIGFWIWSCFWFFIYIFFVGGGYESIIEFVCILFLLGFNEGGLIVSMEFIELVVGILIFFGLNDVRFDGSLGILFDFFFNLSLLFFVCFLFLGVL